MGYVEGFTGEIQRALIGIAEEQGLSASVVQPNTWAGANGWTVPDSVSDAYADSLVAAAKPEPKKRAPRKTAVAEAPEEAPSDPDSEQE